MNASQHQEMDNATLESMLVCSKSPDPRKPRPQPEHALPCPRCESTNTKFCYYNNYSLTQPRYFCKSCRRYWTKGGTLRNVPVGGGCRKNKRSSSSSKRTPDPNSASNPLNGLPPALNYDAGDNLSLAFARLQKSGCFDNENEISGFIGNGTNCDAGFTGSGFFGNSISNFQNFCYGSGDGEMLVPNYQDPNLNLAPLKQEFGSGGVRFDGNEQIKGMWSFPYHGGNGNNNLGEFENAGRESWNGFNSSWHGLLNSPLM